MFNKSKIIKIIVLSVLCNCAVFADDSVSPSQTSAVQKQNIFKRIFTKKSSAKTKKVKKARVEEIVLPPVIQGKPATPYNQLPVMSIDDCVKYALEHNMNLMASKSRIEAAKAQIGVSRSAYAPRLTAKVGYTYSHNDGTRVLNINNNSLGFNVGISDMIWDFGRTTAKINMAKYDAKAAEYDDEYDILNVIYAVRICYYQVLMALADLDIYEQNVRIQTLNFERTKAMFDEGLKSKIDVVNAEVNLTDAKIQLVAGQNNLINSIISLQNSMYYTEEKPFIVKNTESFGFLKADYREKFKSANLASQPKPEMKRNEDGLVLLSSGIEHSDIIQNYVFKPMKLTKQSAVDEALENRPDLKSARMVVNVQDESLKAIRRQYAPQLDTEVSWGYTRQDSTYTSPLTVGANVGLGSINPYSIHYQIKEGENYLDIAKHNYNIAKSDIYWEVQENYVDMRQLERKIPLMNTKVKATLENFELADGRYSVGLNNYVELQDALTNYNNAQLNFVEAVFDYNVSREKLFKSMGINILGDKKWQDDI